MLKPKKLRKIYPLVRLLACAIGLCFIVHSLSQAQDLQGGGQDFPKPSPELYAALGEAELLADTGQFQKASSFLENYYAEHPAERHPLFYYELGYFSYKAGAIEKAMTNVQKSVELAPEFKDGWILLSLAWQEQSRQYSKEKKQEKPLFLRALRKSAMAMEKAAQIAQDDDLLYQSAMLWLEAENVQKAVPTLKALSKKAAPKEAWLAGLAEALKAVHQLEESAEAMEKAARVENNPELLFHAAYLWHELEQPRRALPLLTELTERKKPEKNWFLLLANVYNMLNQYVHAAMVFERVIEMDPAPDYLYNCGVLWLQAKKPDAALRSLLRLAEVTPPHADWFAATAQAWLLKENLAEAADAMEQAAAISKQPHHIYAAGTLRVQLREAERAIQLLTPLAQYKKPKSHWMVALSNAWLLKDNYKKAATYMERAAYISGKGQQYHRAGMLWRTDGNLTKSIVLLEKSVAGTQVEQLWLIDLAAVLFEANRESEVRPVMLRTQLEGKDVTHQLRYRGVGMWLNLQEPARAYPLLKILAADEDPQYSWMSSLVQCCVALGKLQEAEKVLAATLARYPSRAASWKLAVWFALKRGNVVGAVAAKEVVLHFEPDEEKHLNELSRLYLLAGVPKQSARYYTRTLGKNPTSEELEHLVDIYLSGRMYEEALQVARTVVELKKTVENMETLGDIWYALHRYEESCSAYEQGAGLSDKVNPDIPMKAGYSAMKAKQYARAAKNFTAVIDSRDAEDEQVQAARENLVYIEKVQARCGL